MDNHSLLKSPNLMAGQKKHLSPIGVSAIWDQHCRFLGLSRDSQIDRNSETRILCIVGYVNLYYHLIMLCIFHNCVLQIMYCTSFGVNTACVELIILYYIKLYFEK